MTTQPSSRETTSTPSGHSPHSEKFRPELYDSCEAAEYLGYKSPDTLRNARHTGKLAGVTAPRYRKIGNRVVYSRDALDEWLGQFVEQTNTAGDAA